MVAGWHWFFACFSYLHSSLVTHRGCGELRLIHQPRSWFRYTRIQEAIGMWSRKRRPTTHRFE
jgi:hypothetical protein